MKEAKSIRQFIQNKEKDIENGSDYVTPQSLVALARAILEDIED